MLPMGVTRIQSMWEKKKKIGENLEIRGEFFSFTFSLVIELTGAWKKGFRHSACKDPT